MVSRRQGDSGPRKGDTCSRKEVAILDYGKGIRERREKRAVSGGWQAGTLGMVRGRTKTRSRNQRQSRSAPQQTLLVLPLQAGASHRLSFSFSAHNDLNTVHPKRLPLTPVIIRIALLHLTRLPPPRLPLRELKHHRLARQPLLLPPPQRNLPLFTVIAREITPLGPHLLLLPEVRRDDLMPTRPRVLAVTDHRAQTVPLRRGGAAAAAAAAAAGAVLGGVGADAVGDAVALLARVEEDAGGGFAVAAGAAGFLDELLERAREAVVRDEADVRGVDAHPEGGRGGDEVEAAAEGEGLFGRWDRGRGEGALDGGAGGELEPGVVGLAWDAGGGQAGGESVCCDAERDVDDPCDWGTGGRCHRGGLGVGEMAEVLDATVADVSEPVDEVGK